MKIMWLRALVLALLAGAALTVAGCGDDDYNGDAASSGNLDLSVYTDGPTADLTYTHD